MKSRNKFQHNVTEYFDEYSGHRIRQVTSLPGNHHHLYFTSNSFTKDNSHVLIISDAHTGHPNVFKLCLDDGETIQLTKNHSGYLQSYVYYDGRTSEGLGIASPSYNFSTHQLLYIEGREIRLLDVESLEETVLYTLPKDVVTAFTCLSPDGRFACIPYISQVAFDVGAGHPFTQIREKVKHEGIASQVLIIDTQTLDADVLFSHTGWITHVQFNPKDPSQILFNHEGGIVDQRMWLYTDGNIVKVRDQSSDTDGIWICHEVWLQNGREVLYHGTRGFPKDPSLRHAAPNQLATVSFVGLEDVRTGQHIELSFPAGMTDYGHFTLSTGDRRLVTDGVIDNKSIHLCDPNWETGELSWSLVCRHQSSFLNQDVHPHPIFSHDNQFILFTSDYRNERGKGHVYVVDVEP